MKGLRTVTEVRRCAGCGEPTLQCERAWERTVLGVPTGSQVIDLRCATCGVTLTLVPWREIAIERFFGWLFLPAIVPSVFFFMSAQRKARAWRDNPVVAGVQHMPSGPPPRVCACSAVAPCVEVRQRRLRGMPIGTSQRHVCPSCARAFVVYDVAGLVFPALAALVLAGFGALILIFSPGSAVGAEASNAPFGVALCVAAGIAALLLLARLSARQLHPPLDSR